MTYGEILENARKTILNCKACPECNGLGCGNTLPGPGSKAPGNGAYVNWQAWKDIRLNFDTFVEDGPVDTGCTLFGKEFALPLMSGPIGSMTQYSKEDVTVAFNDGVMEGTAATGTIDCFGDGVTPATLPGALESIARHNAAAIPVFNHAVDDAAQRSMLSDTISKSGKETITISIEQMNQFAGNMLQLHNHKGEDLLVMSRSALMSLTRLQIEALEKYTRILAPEIPIIETVGGGSARCMIAEIFQD